MPGITVSTPQLGLRYYFEIFVWCAALNSHNVNGIANDADKFPLR